MLEHTLLLLIDIIKPLLKDYPDVADSLVNHIQELINNNTNSID